MWLFSQGKVQITRASNALVVVHGEGAVTRGRWTSYLCFECIGQWNS